MRKVKVALTVGFGICVLMAGTATAQQTQLLWGDTHLHTNLSADAYIQKNTTADLDAACKLAEDLK